MPLDQISLEGNLAKGRFSGMIKSREEPGQQYSDSLELPNGVHWIPFGSDISVLEPSIEI